MENTVIKFRRKPTPVRNCLLSVSLTLNVCLVALIASYSMGYVHTMRTKTLQPDQVAMSEEGDPIMEMYGKEVKLSKR